MTYHAELCKAMTMLADAGGVFVGQAVSSDGTAMRSTLKHLPPQQLLEFPVAENMQVGFCTGIALAGGLPVCIHPRINFLLEAVSQLAQHLDKIPLYSNFRPRVIIRTAVATDKPLDPGPQHVGDYTMAFRHMLKTVWVARIDRAEDIVPIYKHAMEREGSSLIVEDLAHYGD